MKDKELSDLKREVEELKKKKEREMVFSTSLKEKQNLQREINELEMIKKSPSRLASFGKNFGRGLNMVGKNLWSGITKASKNLQRNSPEFQRLGKKIKTRGTVSEPFSELGRVYLPSTPTYREPPKSRPSKKISKKTKKKMKKRMMNRLAIPRRQMISERLPWEMP